MENPTSVQAMHADICVENCGHFTVKQEISTKIPHVGLIYIKPYIFKET